MDPMDHAVTELKRSAWTLGFTAGADWGRKHMPMAQRVKRALVWFTIGVLTTLWWSGAFAQGVSPEAERYRGDLVRISQSVWGLNAPVSMLAAQIHQESAWNPSAVSRVGAAGLTQFMPATARDVAQRYGGGPPNAFDPRWAMMAQSRYMKELHTAVSGAVNESERFAFALSAYNGGLGRVRQRQRLSPDPGRCLNATCDINPGISHGNQEENRDYPRRIILRIMPKYYDRGWGGPAIHQRYGV